jgi:hypothetical protein
MSATHRPSHRPENRHTAGTTAAPPQGKRRGKKVRGLPLKADIMDKHLTYYERLTCYLYLYL